MPLASGVVNLKAQFGVDTDNDGFLDDWISANEAGWDANGRAVQTATIAGCLRSRPCVSASSPAANSSTAKPARSRTRSSTAPRPLDDKIDITAPAQWRYRVFETIIPLRNVIWNNATMSPRPPPQRPSLRRQRGVVMFVALIVMVAMALAALALIRAVDTTTSVVGNLGFRQASILPANAAVEEVVSALFEKKLIDLTKDNAAQNYYATKQASEDARGIPFQLQKKSNFTLTRVLAADGDNEVRYVDRAHVQSEGQVAPAGTVVSAHLRHDAAQARRHHDRRRSFHGCIRTPFYRLTVRVDGPRNTASFVQVMLR